MRGMVWRYMPSSTVRHALTSVDAATAVCGRGVLIASWWLGDRSPAEQARVAAMPACQSCAKKVRRLRARGSS